MIAGMTSAYHRPEKMKKNNASLLISYFFWSAVFLIYDVVIRVFLLKHGTGRLIRGFLDTVSFQGIDALWFVSTLIFVQLAVTQIQKRAKNKEQFLLISFALLMTAVFIARLADGIFLDEPGYPGLLIKNMTLALARFLSMSFFSAAGYAARDKILFFLNKSNVFIKIVCFTLAFGCTYALSLMNGYVDVHYMKLGNHALIFACTGLIGTFGLLLLSDIVKNCSLKKILAFFGMHSLFIMATHLYLSVLSVSRKMAQWMNIQNGGALFLTEFCLTLLIEIIFVLLAGEKIRKKNKKAAYQLSLRLSEDRKVTRILRESEDLE